MRDVEQLAALAPEAIRSAVGTFRDFLAVGGVDLADPDSNLTGRWPAHVRAAVAAIRDYIATHC